MTSETSDSDSSSRKEASIERIVEDGVRSLEPPLPPLVEDLRPWGVGRLM